MGRLHWVMRSAIVLAVVTVGLTALPLTAFAKEESDRVEFSGPVEVGEGETVGDVVAFNGPVTIRGRADGDVVAFAGRVDVFGEVTGDLVVFRGPLTLHEGARVRGDLVHRGNLRVSPGAVVEGDTHRADLRSLGRRAGTVRWGVESVARIVWWAAISVLTFALGFIVLALGARGQEALVAAARTRTGPSIGWGAALWVGLPILTIGAFITVIGTPIGLLLALILTVLYPFAYAVSAWVLGRSLVRGPGRAIVALVAGWAILRGLALIPVVGGAVWVLATLFGLGVCLVAITTARRPPAETTPAPPGGGGWQPSVPGAGPAWGPPPPPAPGA